MAHQSEITSATVQLEHVSLEYGTAGARGGPPVLFLHGWPDLRLTWEAQMQSLAARGYYCIAPDQRGFGRSSKPPRVNDYALPVLTNDIVQFIERLGLGPVHVVGHDWGGAVAWSLALTRPHLVQTLTVVNSPHPWVFARNLMFRPQQTLRSWYMFLFQVPGLAETLLGYDDSALQMKVLSHGAPIKDAALLARYREQWRTPGAIGTPLNWYRALFRNLFTRASLPLRQKARVPTMVVWSAGDPAFAPDSGEDSVRWCEHGELHTFRGGHWPFHQHPDDFDALLNDWLMRHRADAGASSERKADTRG